MTREEFIILLESKGYDYDISGDSIIINRGDEKNIVSLELIDSMPSDVEFSKNCEGVRLYNLKELPPRVYFNNSSYVNLKSLEYIDTEVEFNNGAMVHLDSLKELNPNVKFNNGGYVAVNSLEKISQDFEFNNGGNVYFSNFNTKTWDYSIDGINSRRLLNFIIKKGIINLLK
jgi:hypothetical protein